MQSILVDIWKPRVLGKNSTRFSIGSEIPNDNKVYNWLFVVGPAVAQFALVKWEKVMLWTIKIHRFTAWNVSMFFIMDAFMNGIWGRTLVLFAETILPNDNVVPQAWNDLFDLILS